MFNLRYHIASLVAIFLALSIGLLLGTVVAERGTLDDQRVTIVNSLESDFKELSTQNDELKKENTQREQYVNDILPLLIGGKLEGKTVLIMSNTGRADGLSATQDAIKQAGGTPAVITFTRPGLGLDDPAISEAASSALPADVGPVSPETVASVLGAEWSRPAGQRPLTDALVAADVLKVVDFPVTSSAQAVVVLASWEGEADQLAMTVATDMSDQGIPASGVEASGMPSGVAEACASVGLSFVDDMGRAEGAFSLVRVLAGEATGGFGTGESAQQTYPSVQP